MIAGSIILRQITKGGDGTFAFTSATAGLNVSIITSGGAGETTPISLAPGNYAIAATQNTGFGLTSITCSSGGLGDLGTTSARINLAAGAAVSCTFTSYKLRQRHP